MNPNKVDTTMTTRSKGNQATVRAASPDHDDMPPNKRVRRNSNPESVTPPVKGHHRTRSTAGSSRSSTPTPTPPVGKEGKQLTIPITVSSKAKAEGKLTPSSVKKRSLSSMLESGTVPNVPAPRFRKIGQNNGSGVNNQNDYFCWICHRDGTVIVCEVCPRVFHPKCLGLENNQPEDWVCPECEKIMRAECVDTQSKSMSMISLEQLCMLLKFSLERMQHPTSDPFERPVDLNAVPHYKDYIFNPMDLGQLEKNIDSKMYGCTEAFLADSKWILHNCIIYNGTHHKLTSSAKLIVKICKHETSEIEICPDCYMNSCLQRNDNWFCEPCRTPHTLVWAKLKGYPFWPAKALREVDGQVDVRFFGAHDRSWVPVSQVFLLSKDIPTAFKNKRASGFDQAMEEIHLHIDKIREEFGTFEYAAFRTPYDINNVYFHNKMKISTAAAMMKMSKMKSAKSVKKNQGLLKTGNNSPKSAPRKNPVDGKQLEKSMATKTASAVKIKYNSIITTRRAAAAKIALDDSLATESEDPPKLESSPETGSDQATPMSECKETGLNPSKHIQDDKPLLVSEKIITTNTELGQPIVSKPSLDNTTQTLVKDTKQSETVSVNHRQTETPKLHVSQKVKIEPISPEAKPQTKSEVAITNLPSQTMSDNLQKDPVLSRAKLLGISPKTISSSSTLNMTSPSFIQVSSSKLTVSSPSSKVSSHSQLMVTSNSISKPVSCSSKLVMTSSSVIKPISPSSQYTAPVVCSKTSVLSGVFTLSDKVIKPLANKLILSRTTKPVVSKPTLPNSDVVNKLEITLEKMKNDDKEYGYELEREELNKSEPLPFNYDTTLLKTNCDTEKEKCDKNVDTSNVAKNVSEKVNMNSQTEQNVTEANNGHPVSDTITKPTESQGQTTEDHLTQCAPNSTEHLLHSQEIFTDTEPQNVKKSFEISPGKASYLEKLQKTIESCKAKLGLEGEAADDSPSEDDGSSSEDSDESNQEAPDEDEDNVNNLAKIYVENGSAETKSGTSELESSQSGEITQSAEFPKESLQADGKETPHETTDKKAERSDLDLEADVKSKPPKDIAFNQPHSDSASVDNCSNDKDPINNSANTVGSKQMEVDKNTGSVLPENGKTLTTSVIPLVKKKVIDSEVLHRKCVTPSNQESDTTPMEVDTDTDSNNLVIDLDDPISSPMQSTSEDKVLKSTPVTTKHSALSEGNSSASSNQRASNLKTILTSPEDGVITTITPVLSTTISNPVTMTTNVLQASSSTQNSKTATLSTSPPGIIKGKPVNLNATKPSVIASASKQPSLFFPTPGQAQKILHNKASKFVPIVSKPLPVLAQVSPVILTATGTAKSPPSGPPPSTQSQLIKVALPGPPPLQLSPQVAAATAAAAASQNKKQKVKSITTTMPASITFKTMGPGSAVHGTVTLPTQKVPVTPPLMSKLNLAKLAPININKYMTQILSSVKNSVNEMYSDLTSDDKLQTAMKHFQLELEKAEWMHKREIAEMKHNLDLSVFEMKKGYEAKLASVSKALQVKHEKDKQSAIAEVKKKQWCANCGKEAIFYCCWNTSYCDYPCQTNHWPSHMDNCTQSHGFHKSTPVNQPSPSEGQITQVAKAVTIKQTTTASPSDENMKIPSRLEAQQRLNWKERMATIQQLEEKEMGRRGLMNATANGIPHLSQHQMMPQTSSHNHFTGPVLNPVLQPGMSNPGGQGMMGQMMTPAVGLTEQMLRSGKPNQLPNLSEQMIRGSSNQIVNPVGQSIQGNMGQIPNSSGQMIQTTTGGPILQIRFPVSTQQGFSVLQQQQSMVAQNTSRMYPIVNQQGQGHVIQHGPIIFPQNQQRSPANIDSKNNFQVHNRPY